MFCQLYASDKEFFGNGVESYIEAYDLDVTENKGVYSGARASASKLLTNTNILKRINELLELGILNDTFVDKQLAFLIGQNADLPTKRAAITEYNKLKSRITEKLESINKNMNITINITKTYDNEKKLNLTGERDINNNAGLTGETK